MSADVGLPIQMIGKDRDEILVVYFDGFIKNESECVIRTMLKDINTWVEKYPMISEFIDFDRDELYHDTMLFRPDEILCALSYNNISDEEIDTDLEEIIPNINFTESKITRFEYALFRILQEPNIKTCYFIKDDKFYDNEIEYVKKKYSEVIGKIEFIEGGLLSLFDEVNPTTMFITDPSIPIDIFQSEYTEEQLSSKLFILLNSIHNTIYDVNNGFTVSEEFNKIIKQINDATFCGILTMYNLPIAHDLEDGLYEGDDLFDNDSVNDESEDE